MTVAEPIGGSELTIEDVEDLARWALEEHGLAARDCTFGWDRAVRQAGCCHLGVRRITLSCPTFVPRENRDKPLETILHEVAHALAGHEAGHGLEWLAVAESLGARPERCYDGLAATRLGAIGTYRCGTRHRKARMQNERHRYSCKHSYGEISWSGSEARSVSDARTPSQ